MEQKEGSKRGFLLHRGKESMGFQSKLFDSGEGIFHIRDGNNNEGNGGLRKDIDSIVCKAIGKRMPAIPGVLFEENPAGQG